MDAFRRVRSWVNGDQRAPHKLEMTRAYCRDLTRLRSVRRLVQDLARSEAHHDVVLEEFWDVWNVFEAALAGGEGDGAAGRPGAGEGPP